jgi:hypothetical protein
MTMTTKNIQYAFAVMALFIITVTVTMTNYLPENFFNFSSDSSEVISTLELPIFFSNHSLAQIAPTVSNFSLDPSEELDSPQEYQRASNFSLNASGEVDLPRDILHSCLLQGSEPNDHESRYRVAQCLCPRCADMKHPIVSSTNLSGAVLLHGVAYNRHSRTFRIKNRNTAGETMQPLNVVGFSFEPLPFYHFFSSSSRQEGYLDPKYAPVLVDEAAAVVCTSTVPVGVLAHADLGAVYTNLWHMISTWLQPIFCIIHDAEDLPTSDPRDFYLLSQRLPVNSYPNNPKLERLAHDVGAIHQESKARGMIAAIFGGSVETLEEHMAIVDLDDPVNGTLCFDRLYVRTNRNWDPSQSIPEMCGDVPRMMLSWRSFMLSRFQIPEPDARLPLPQGATISHNFTASLRVLWISRAGSDNKHMLNEHDLIAAVDTRMGSHLRVVRLEELAELDQLRAFVEADLVVGFRGAGLTNAVFLRPGSVMLMVGGQGFKIVNAMDRLWFKVVNYDPSTLGGNPNWENITVPEAEFMGAFESALQLLISMA